MIEKSPIFPKIILDTKGEDKFDRFLTGDNIEVVKLKEFRKLQYAKLPEYTVIRPSRFELAESDLLDLYPDKIYTMGKPCFFFVDELYQLHHNGRAGAGLLGVLTRGRSKGITFLGGCQRPTWISRFCLTESQKFYIYRLLDTRDRKNLAEIIFGFGRVKPAEKFHFHFYDANTGESRYYAPFEYVDHQPKNKRVII